MPGQLAGTRWRKDSSSLGTGSPTDAISPDGIALPHYLARLNQWFLKITAFADRLLAGADGLKWPSHVLDMQRAWIGRSEGFQFEFEVENKKNTGRGDSDRDDCGVAAAATVVAFTTRPETIYGATFLSVATDHPLTEHPAVTDSVRAAVAALAARDPDTGDPVGDGGAVPLGVTARHPLYVKLPFREETLPPRTACAVGAPCHLPKGPHRPRPQTGHVSGYYYFVLLLLRTVLMACCPPRPSLSLSAPPSFLKDGCHAARCSVSPRY